MRTAFPLAALLLFTAPAWADLPLTIEDLITEQGRLKFDLSFGYANVEQQGISTGQPLLVQTGPNSWVSIPTRIGERRGNTDTMVSTLGLRYGLTEKAEIYARTSHLHTRQRDSSDAGGLEKTSQSQFADAWAGINYQFLQNENTPALLGFAEIALREKHSYSSASGKSALLGLTTYTAVDPIVFSYTAAYRVHRTRLDGGVPYRPGNSLMQNPSVAFAVNDRVTLNSGVQWISQQAEHLDGQAQGLRRTKTDLILGASYGFTEKNTLSANIMTNASGQDGADLRIHWLRQF